MYQNRNRNFFSDFYLFFTYYLGLFRCFTLFRPKIFFVFFLKPAKLEVSETENYELQGAVNPCTNWPRKSVAFQVNYFFIKKPFDRNPFASYKLWTIKVAIDCYIVRCYYYVVFDKSILSKNYLIVALGPEK